MTTAEDRAGLLALPGRLRALSDELAACRAAAERMHGPPPAGWDEIPGRAGYPWPPDTLRGAAWKLAGALDDAAATVAGCGLEAAALVDALGTRDAADR